MLGRAQGGVCAKVLPTLLQGLQFSLLFCFRLNQLAQGFTHTQWVPNDPETLTSESQVLRNSGCLHETEGSSGPRRALREATGLGRVAGRNKNPGSKGAQAKGAGVSADLEIRGRATVADTLFADQPRLCEWRTPWHSPETGGARGERGGQWRKTAMSGVIKQSPSGGHAERGLSLGSACNFFQQDPKSPVHRSN